MVDPVTSNGRTLAQQCADVAFAGLPAEATVQLHRHTLAQIIDSALTLRGLSVETGDDARDAARWRWMLENLTSGYGDGVTEPKEKHLSLFWQQGPWIRDGSNGGAGRADEFPGWAAIIDRQMAESAVDLTELEGSPEKTSAGVFCQRCGNEGPPCACPVCPDCNGTGIVRDTDTNQGGQCPACSAENGSAPHKENEK